MLKVLVLLLIMAGSFGAYANIIDVDSRRSITDAGKLRALDLTFKDAERIRAATGYVECPGTKFGNHILASGALVGADDILVTNAHVFVDDKGRWREPLEQCFFQNQTEKFERRALSFADGDFEIVHDYSSNNGANDYAVIRLKSKIPGAKSFPVVAAGAPLTPSATFVMVSASVEKVAGFSPFAPVVQGCQFKQIEDPAANRNTVFLADCDVMPGSSGSINLISINGELTAVGITAGGGKMEQNGREFNLDIESYSFHVAFRDALLSAILRLMRAPL